MIVVRIKTIAITKGMDRSRANLAGETANPVIEGLATKKLIIRIAETAFAMNKEIFMFIHLHN